MAKDDFSKVYRKLARDSKFYDRVAKAPSAEDRLKLLREAGLDPNASFDDLREEVESILRKRGKSVEESAPPADEGGEERAVEWVAAAAVVIAAGIAT